MAQTRKRIEDLISGKVGAAGQRSELVKLAAQLIMEAALGRGYYAHGRGYRNGDRWGQLETAAGRIEYAVPPVRGLEGGKSAVRGALSGRREKLARLAIELYARGLSVRDIEAACVAECGRCARSKGAVSVVTERLWADYPAFAGRELSAHAAVYLCVDGLAAHLPLGQVRGASGLGNHPARR